jgi:hypothetical protein
VAHALAAGTDGGGLLRQSPDAAGRSGGRPQAGDLVVLSGELSEGLGPELGEFVHRGGRRGEPLLQRGDLVFEAGDLGVARVGPLAGLVEGLRTSFELDAEVGVGAVAVEGCAVDAPFTDNDDGLRGFELTDHDGYVLFFGRPA